jgi:hypothetical protein
MDRILLHVKFEGGLSVPVLRNEATFFYKTLEFKTDEFSKILQMPIECQFWPIAGAHIDP